MYQSTTRNINTIGILLTIDFLCMCIYNVILLISNFLDIYKVKY
jgi:hypothetical protein